MVYQGRGVASLMRGSRPHRCFLSATEQAKAQKDAVKFEASLAQRSGARNEVCRSPQLAQIGDRVYTEALLRVYPEAQGLPEAVLRVKTTREKLIRGFLKCP